MVWTPLEDGRRLAQATQRNQQAILQVLQKVLPSQGTVLEIASGTGEHAIYFTPRLTPRYWLPSDCHPDCIKSIDAWQQYSPHDHLYAPVYLNTCDSFWEVEDQNWEITAIVAINLIHIAPWTACLGLMAGAQRVLPTGGVLYLYGAYKRNGEHTAPSNVIFDHSLKAQNPAWGVRDMEAVIAVAEEKNLICQAIIPMPSNNFSLVFVKH